MDRDMAFLASNDASRAMHGGRETTEYTEQRTSEHTRSGSRECVLAVPFAFVCFVDFVVTLLSVAPQGTVEPQPTENGVVDREPG